MLKALIFDVDGTLADTEMAHLKAFNHAFKEQGFDWYWDVETYTRLLEVSGGKERILHYWRGIAPDLLDLDGTSLETVVSKLHESKSLYYEGLVDQGQVPLRPGVMALINEAVEANIPLAIATTTSAGNVRALLKRHMSPEVISHFSVIEDASTADHKKPHPQAYLQAVERLGLAACDCLAFEDSLNGLKAATSAGLKTVVTPNAFTTHQDLKEAWWLKPSLSNIHLYELQERFLSSHANG
jgi:HAD superfamily hydrolase (TIGR01509 family)